MVSGNHLDCMLTILTLLDLLEMDLPESSLAVILLPVLDTS